MKRLTMIAIAICLCLSLAAPAMAVDVDFSGYFWSRGQSNSNRDLGENDATDSYGYMKFRMKTDIKVNDNIKLTTQFDALDNKRFGKDDAPTVTYTSWNSGAAASNTSDTATVNEKSNIDWDVAYATIKTPIGGFLFGRWYGTPWGTSFADSNQDPDDKITWVVPMDKWMFALQYKKIQEADEGTTISDGDWDKYYAVVNYKTDNWRTGLLGSFYNLKNFTTPGQVQLAKDYLIPAEATTGLPRDNAATIAAATGAIVAAEGAKIPGYIAGGMTVAQASAKAWSDVLMGASSSATADTQIYVINPYFVGTFGGLTIEAEFAYGTGETVYDAQNLNGLAAATPFATPGDYSSYKREDTDVEGMGGMIDLVYDFGMFSLNGGYAYASGDNNLWDNESGSFAYLEPSGDFKKLFILTGAGGSHNGGLATNLGGGLGNLAGGQTKEIPLYGYKLWFFGAGVTPMENLTIDFLIGSSEADEVPTGYDDEHGTEYDLTAVWKPMDNLSLRGLVAHLDAGDIYKLGVANAKLEDNTTYLLEARIDF